MPRDEDDDALEDETRALIDMLRYEVGWRWMSCRLRLQIEEIEVMIGDRGTIPIGMTTVAK